MSQEYVILIHKSGRFHKVTALKWANEASRKRLNIDGYRKANDAELAEHFELEEAPEPTAKISTDNTKKAKQTKIVRKATSEEEQD